MKRTLLILLISLPVFVEAQIITTVAGKGTPGFSGDGSAATAAQINHPNGIAIDTSGNIYVSDYFNHRIRKVSPAGVISTFAGTGTPGYCGDGGPAISACLYYPVGIAIDVSGNIYFADASNNRIRKINASGIISTVAGNGGTGYSGDGGPAISAQLHWPSAVALDGSGNIYIADYSSNRIRKVSPAGIITTFAGNGIAGYSGDGGIATAAELNLPYGVTFHSGDIYIAEYGNNIIRKVSPSNIISTFAGSGVSGYSGDGGPATAAEFNLSQGIIFDQIGNSYIIDVNNQRVRKINSSGIINTVAGNGIAGYSGDGGLATLAELNAPAALAIDSKGDIFFPEYLNHVIRKMKNTPNYVSDSFSIYISSFCSSTQITLVPNHYSSGMYIKTFYGDGTSDSSAVLSTGSAIINHNYANSGTYTIKHILHNSTSVIDSFHYTYAHVTCNSFTVKFYYDANANCIKDSAEGYNSQPLAIEIDSSGIAIDTICATSGLYYTAYGPVGTVYAFKSLSAPSGMHISCPSTGIIYDTISATSYSPTAKYVALSCITSMAFDLSVNAITTATGVSDQYGVIYIQNNFCLPTNGTITLHYSPKYGGHPRDIYPAATSFSGNTIVWNISSLSSTLSSPASINYGVWHNTTLLAIGDTVHSYFTIDPVLGDADTGNNAQIIIDTVKGGCDPNEMWVNPSCIPTGDTATQLQYTINFENTGNDTAHNIYIMDTLSDNVNISSMRIVMSSHEMYTSHFKDGGGHNVMKFDFPAINLLDSSHHGQCNGSVIFNIDTKPGLLTSSNSYNQAGIYFDVNAVVMTNVVNVIIGCSPENVNITANNKNINIYPNPTSTELTISSKDRVTAVAITNLIGQTLYSNQCNSSQLHVDVSALPTGMYLIRINGTEVRKFVKE